MHLVMREIRCGAGHSGRLSLSQSVRHKGNLKKAGHQPNPRYVVDADGDRSLMLTGLYV